MIEVRITTFRRPQRLRRALRSLQDQTCTEWRAVVLEDSSGREGESVVREMNDGRFHYRPNDSNLGRVRNINQAFTPESYFEDSMYACVLEDDNWYDPTLLERNLTAMLAAGCNVLARNYRIIDVDDGAEEQSTDFPLIDMYGDRARRLSFRERLTESFFNFGLGNFGYFWNIRSGVDLSMNWECFDVHIAETGRSLCFREDCWFEPEPISNFSRFVDKGMTPSSERKPDDRDGRLGRISEVYHIHRLLYLWRRELNLSVRDLLEIARKRGCHVQLKERLAAAGVLACLTSSGMSSWIKAAKILPLLALYGRDHARQTRILSGGASSGFRK